MGKVLARLKPEEGGDMLRALLERHPELVAEAEDFARATVIDVDADAVAADVAQAVLDLNVDDLEARAGRKRWGYVEPTEAAWELLAEAIDPFLAEMERRIELGFEAAATATCAGIVLGLYRCRDKSSDHVLGWAEDFPAETAGRAVATLARESDARHRRTWRLGGAILDQVPKWTAMIGRAIFAAQPGAWAEAARSEENDDDRPQGSEENHPRPPEEDPRVVHDRACPRAARSRRPGWRGTRCVGDP